MLLDDAQRKAVNVTESIFLQAGPGSGKTRTLVAKALRELTRSRAAPSRIGCITLSRAAAGEIRDRVSALAPEIDLDRLTVSTIHGFCLAEIFEPYHRFVPEYEHGWSILPDHEERYQALIEETFKGQLEAARRMRTVRRSASGDPENFGTLRASDVSKFWRRLEEQQFIDFPSLLYRSLQILAEHSAVARHVRSKYSWLLVDEYQDTTSQQLNVLRALNGPPLKFFLVGDFDQSIYGFAGASKVEQEAFVVAIGARVSLRLQNNYRSTTQICTIAARIGNSEMMSMAEPRDGPEPELFMVRDRDYGVLAQTLTDEFLPAMNAAGLEDDEVAIITPDSYVARDLIDALNARGRNVRVPDVLLEDQQLLRVIRGFCEWELTDRREGIERGAQALTVLLELDRPTDWNVDEYALARLPYEVFESSRGLLIGGGTVEAVVTSVAGVICELSIRANIVHRQWKEAQSQANRWLTQIVSRDRVFEPPDFRLHQDAVLTTWIAQTKGLEFKAAALVEVNGGRIPHYRETDPSQGRRLMYVGVTRPGHVLRFYSDRRKPSPFISELVRSGNLNWQ